MVRQMWSTRRKRAPSHRGLVMGAAALVLMTSAACSSQTQAPVGGGQTPALPAPSAFEPEPAIVTIATEVDPSGALGGTFKVEEGADTLGCSSGSYADSGWGPGHRKVFTCEAGGTGTFAVNVHPDSVFIDPGPPETWTGTWGIDGPASTGDFVGLQGFGVFEVVFTKGGRPAAETLSGEIYG
jgi:hypothetical protein